MSRSRSHSGSRASVIDALAEIPLLRGCSRRDLVMVDRCTTRVDLEPGATLCQEGRLGREAFLIVDGEADVVVGSVIVARLAAGDICGEMALLDRTARTATVTALTPMTVLAMSRGEFDTLVGSASSFTRRLLHTTAARLRDADRTIAEHARDDAHPAPPISI